ncbi:protease modulator HflC [uncultured Mailhella sp.]|uniref:protease modulator HflC n=1 Tax=uncultured Mailhella sp. TaxID=1981031 RepID=UPI0025F81607|nr:protease modulator HflC [uncultured Mailhella sp.]
MKGLKSILLLPVLLVAALLAQQTLFVVDQTQQALVIQLGHPLDKVYGPGLHAKLPFIQNVVYFEARILDYDARPAEALTSDLKTIVLDNYARWKIEDPLQFYRTMRTETNAQARLDAVIYSQIRAHVGRHTLTEVVADERNSIMESVTEKASQQMKEFGIAIVDVRIKRTDLPAENQRAIFDRMRAERERQATQYRSEGAEESTKIRSGAEKERALILAEAGKKAQVLRGEGDAEAARIYAEAFSRSPEFFSFQRGLEALRKSLGENTRMVLTPDSPLLQPIK